MPRKRKQKKKSPVLFIFLIVLILATGAFFLWISTFTIPNIQSFEERKITQSTKIYDRTGEILLYDVFENIKRTVVPLEDISPLLQKAVISIEDKNFYEHNGVSIWGIIRGQIVPRLQGKRVQGGSTITQQLVKNALLTNERRLERKVKEWVLAFKLEQKFSKEDILEMYLNEIPYGGSIYGAEEASKVFFGKSAKELSLAEAAYLAALPKAPTYYSPYGKNRDELDARKNVVLEEMYNLGHITEEDKEKAKNETVKFLPQEPYGIKAPHFVLYVRDQLIKEYGEDVIENGGLKVTTTLDYELQKEAEEIVKKTALENEEKFNAENASAVAINPKTGEVLAMVGSRDYFDEDIDGNFNIATAHRQPGSVFKPFAYAQAFNRGYLPETIVFDVPTEFSTVCSSGGECYSPSNYDNKFRGPVSFRDALAQSINVPSIKVLYLAGMNETLQLAKDMGIKSLGDIGQYGLTLVLGGGEVSLLDVTGAYGVFANEGRRTETNPILEIEDREGNILYEFRKQEQQVLATDSALKISDVLSDNKARTPAFGSNSALYFPNPDVAVKTGTTNDYRDAWVVGYSSNVVVGTWAGNNDNTPMEKKVAGFILAPMWQQIMSEALETYGGNPFPTTPEEKDLTIPPIIRGNWRGGASVLIDEVSGGKATDYTPEETLGEIAYGGIHSILHWVNKDEPRGERPEDPTQDPQYYLWENPVRNWVIQNGIVERTSTDIPDYFDNVHIPSKMPTVEITSPEKNKVYSPKEKITIQVDYKSTYPVKKVEYFLNNVYLGVSENRPYSFSFIPEDSPSTQRDNTIQVVLYDKVYNSVKSEKTFILNQ